jgi:glycerate kinase
MKTSTFGTGELIKNAIEEGCKNIVLMIGGSATNEGGIGAANALGFNFLSKNNK